ncbi:MAG: acyltransferase [Muribaculaceae bacterium]
MITCSHVSLGDKVRLGPRCRLMGVTRYGDISFHPTIEFGNNVFVMQDFYLTCASKITIGDNTAIAAFVTITDINHPYSDIETPIEAQPIVFKEVTIEADCKIYNGAVITYGTHIGRHCVIGANSVVSGNFPDFCVIAGNPARIIKRYNPEVCQWQHTDPQGNFL